MSQTPVPTIDPEEEIGFMNIDETDFSTMSRAEQIRYFEVEGYVVFPRILTPEIIAKLKSELADAEMSHTSYSVHQTRSATTSSSVDSTLSHVAAPQPALSTTRSKNMSTPPGSSSPG